MSTMMLTHSGRYVNLANPQVEDITIADITHSLARLARFNGHTKGRPLSVAQHSCMVSTHAGNPETPFSRPFILAALLHDAHEAYLGDIAIPVANLIGYERILYWKTKLQQVIHERFGLPPLLPNPWAASIHETDRRMLVTEAYELLPGVTVEIFEEYGEPYDAPIYGVWGVDEAERKFLRYFASYNEESRMREYTFERKLYERARIVTESEEEAWVALESQDFSCTVECEADLIEVKDA